MRIIWAGCDWDAPDLVANSDGSFEDHGVLDALVELETPHVALSGGGSIYVEPTRALVAVDVNTGGDTSPAAGLKANWLVRVNCHVNCVCGAWAGKSRWIWHQWPRRTANCLKAPCAAPFVPTQSTPHWSVGRHWAITSCNANANGCQHGRACQNELPDL